MPGPATEAPAGLPADWPHRDASRRVRSGGVDWHVQVFDPTEPPATGAAPDLLLLHGTGASSHSWRDVAPQLAQRCRVLVPDLPGHAYTARPTGAGLTLPGMAALLGGLLKTLDSRPVALVGHSAGAAIAARMALDGQAEPACVVSLNGAWLPPAGSGRWFYEPMARLLAHNPFVPALFAFQAGRPAMLQRLVDSTGSRLDASGLALYRRLVSDSRHVGAVLAMMASWDLTPLLQDLHRLRPALHLVVSEGDLTVPPATSKAAAQRVAGAVWHRLPRLGHLAHEEDPQALAGLLRAIVEAPIDGSSPYVYPD